MSGSLAQVGRGFAQPAQAAQQVFRVVLDAVARPGRIQALSSEALAGLDDAGLGAARAAVLLALLDAETTVWLDRPLHEAGAPAHLRFHTGVRIVQTPDHAAFAVIDAHRTPAGLWRSLQAGTDMTPQDGATLVVEVVSFARGRTLSLRGPGIESSQRLRVEGLEPPFWEARAELEREFPRGVELILTCGERLAAVPRTSRILLED